MLAVCVCGGVSAQYAKHDFPDDKDYHTYSHADSISVSHLSLDIVVDFTKKQISGSTQWQLKRRKDAASVVFDTYHLGIDSVLDAKGKKLAFSLGTFNDILGSPLRIQLPAEATTVKIYYHTSEGTTALQWLQPGQTFGKKDPFLYTQSESIYARSWLPCQDGPGIRYTYDAQVKVPQGLLALMSAENPQAVNNTGVYKFTMDKPIPAYLMALAVGNIAFKPIDKRTGVYAEPAIIEKAAAELADMGKLVQTAENLYGPYRWGRYDVLVLPSGFPIGGMENPKLTFATPTILAGDKSLVNLIAHELAHNWSGNLVTNRTWNDFWLNEGFTVYFERRIMEALKGKDYVDMLWELGYQDMAAAVQDLGMDSKDTWLKLDLKDRDPDIGLTDIAYEKGAAFLFLVEHTVGRKNMDEFLRKYFDGHAFKTISTEDFIAYLDKNLLAENPEWSKQIDVNSWIYGPGIPVNCPRVGKVRFGRAEAQSDLFTKGRPAKSLQTTGWTTFEWMHFLRHLPTKITNAQLADLDAAYHFTQTGNSEIADLWYLLALQHGYTPAYDAMKQFLYVTGRQKFLEPLYKEMIKTPDGRKMAEEIYQIARLNYHPLTQKTIDEILQAK
ncbi:MAG: M1 family metallopeptidase [Edaphocola sp.]